MSTRDVTLQHPLAALSLPAERRLRDRVGALAGGRGAVLSLSVVASAAFVWTFLPTVLVAIDAARRHRVFLGVTGIWPMDQLQYLSWTKDAGIHGLIRNLYGLGGSPIFVHPIFTPTGLIAGATGLPPVVFVTFWQLASICVLLWGCLHLVFTRIEQGAARRAVALALCLFGGLTPVVGVLPIMDPFSYAWHYRDVAGALLMGTALWAYAPLAIAVGLTPFALEQIERGLRDGGARAWRRAAIIGFFIAWLHPWQGEELLLIAVALWIWNWRTTRQRRPAFLLMMALGVIIPILYYWILSHIDVGWRTSAHDSVGASVIPFSVLVTCLAPLAVVILLSVRKLGVDRQMRALVIWPGAVLATMFLTPNGQYRAISGLALPLGVLVVRAWPSYGTRRRRVSMATAGVLAAFAPSVPYLVNTLGQLNSPANRAYTELSASDVRAAAFAATRADGRLILSPAEIGTAIPALADARVWVGHPIWTPDHLVRDKWVAKLFTGELRAPAARSFVQSTGAGVVLEPCSYRTSLRGDLAPLGFRETRIGCAQVFVAAPSGPLQATSGRPA